MLVKTTYKFEEIKTKRTKRWTDEDGKKRQKTKTFSQTLNPFNKNKNGTLKTRQQIWDEINIEADKWLSKNTKE